ncbi:MAG: SUMF1/EgtB/PvdO family nonheme iron enzyme [Gammaproteobacteria bacterium]|nr:SUMF1/EgtB/PvdO family nonheme iron enzyme [Gammaproteobacteria bacterium]
MILSAIKVIFTLLVFCLPPTLQAESFSRSFGVSFVRINPGSFIMGNQHFGELATEVPGERMESLKKELPAHKVTISKEFYLATTEVTQALWQEMMHDQPGKEERWEREDWASIPVSRVSWEDVKEFIQQLNMLDSEYRYRLPTEAEWEYAARAGSSGLRPFDFNAMGDYAWYRDNSGDKPMPVGSLKPNAWGLYDMIGNVWEWVEDSYDPEYYQYSPELDPRGGDNAYRKSMRGGSYHCTTERVRVGIRGSFDEERSMSVLGFRLAAEKR